MEGVTMSTTTDVVAAEWAKRHALDLLDLTASRVYQDENIVVDSRGGLTIYVATYRERDGKVQEFKEGGWQTYLAELNYNESALQELGE
jgi:hypothetical protein